MSKYIDRATADPLFSGWREKLENTIKENVLFPKRWTAWFGSWLQKEKDEWFAERYLCLKDPLLLGGFIEPEGDDGVLMEPIPVIGMDFQETPHALLFKQFLEYKPGEHAAFGDLDLVFKKRMILWPRGLFKTSAIVVKTVQTILNYPNIRICFLTGGDQLAKRQLARIKRVFEKPTQRFQLLFPEFCLKSVLDKKTQKWEDTNPKMGNAHEFTVPARTTDIFAEPTFSISTAKSVKAGSHYDLIIIDDLVNETNYRSIKLLEKVYQDYLDICPLLEPSGFIWMTGTRYSYGDTYERIQEMAQEEEKQIGKTIWKFSIRDCWTLGCKHCSHPESWHNKDINILRPPCAHPTCSCTAFESDGVKGVLFPAVRTRDGRTIGHTLEFLEGEKIRLGEEFFSNQYENNPIAKGTQTFTETLLGAQTLHQETQLPPYASAYTFAVGDLAYVGQPDRDYSVIYLCRKFQGQIFIYDCEFGNWDSDQIAEMTCALALKHRPAIFYYERFNGWDAYNNVITSRAKEKNLEKLPIEWIKMDQSPKAKLTRIGSIKGVLQGRRLWFYASMKGYATLVKQLVKWPKLGRHDDFADCAGLVCSAPTGYEAETPPPPPSAQNWLRRLNQSNPPDDSYADNGCGTGIVC